MESYYQRNSNNNVQPSHSSLNLLLRFDGAGWDLVPSSTSLLSLKFQRGRLWDTLSLVLERPTITNWEDDR